MCVFLFVDVLMETRGVFYSRVFLECVFVGSWMDLVINLHLVQEGDFLQFLREAFDKKIQKGYRYAPKCPFVPLMCVYTRELHISIAL